MRGTIEYIYNLIVNSGLIYYTLMISIFFLSLSLFLYFYKYNELSFTLFYIGLTFFHMFLVAINPSWAIKILYVYYAFLFLAYHLFFTFSKRFYLITIIVIKQYLKGSEYFKLLLWLVVVFLTSLLLENFILVVIFTPLLGFALVISNFPLFFFLLGQWFWMCMLIFFNKFKIHMNFLRKIHKYFSRTSCLHYLGSNISLKKANKVGVIAVLAPLWLLPHNMFFYLIAQEAKTGHYAIGKMHEYELNHPESTPDQRYKVYEDSYYGYANRFGFLKPAAPDAIIPNYKSDLASIKDNLEDPYK